METINKVTVMPEAAFDYGECLCLGQLNKSAIKTETAEYINNMNRSGRLRYDNYFRCKFYDERSGRMLMLFLYRAEKFLSMQNWNLAGICFAEDWSEELEDDGLVRNWLKEKVADVPEYDDWVVGFRANKIINNADSEKEAWEDVLEEVKNAFECGRDKEAAEKLFLLQSVHFRRRESEATKPSRQVRRCNRRA
jgi:hypothetical protein